MWLWYSLHGNMFLPIGFQNCFKMQAPSRFSSHLEFHESFKINLKLARLHLTQTVHGYSFTFFYRASVAVEANNARNSHISLISVGIGSNVNTGELQAIADDPDLGHMFSRQDYSHLQGLSKDIIDAACQGKWVMLNVDSIIFDSITHYTE